MSDFIENVSKSLTKIFPNVRITRLILGRNIAFNFMETCKERPNDWPSIGYSFQRHIQTSTGQEIDHVKAVMSVGIPDNALQVLVGDTTRCFLADETGVLTELASYTDSEGKQKAVSASHLIVDPCWTPVPETQSIARQHRIQPEKKLSVEYTSAEIQALKDDFLSKFKALGEHPIFQALSAGEKK